MCLFKHKICQCHKCSKEGEGLWVKIEGRGGGINLETECFIYSITGRLTTILYAIIGCLIEKSLTLSLVVG